MQSFNLPRHLTLALFPATAAVIDGKFLRLDTDTFHKGPPSKLPPEMSVSPDQGTRPPENRIIFFFFSKAPQHQEDKVVDYNVRTQTTHTSLVMSVQKRDPFQRFCDLLLRPANVLPGATTRAVHPGLPHGARRLRTTSRTGRAPLGTEV